MEKLKNAVTGLAGFLRNTLDEAKKASWPTREELLQSTVVVIVTVVLLGLYVGVCDKLLITLLQLITQSGGS